MPRSSKRSAGLVILRFRERTPEVLLVHPGGPFWRNKDAGAWSIPKGEVEAGDTDELEAAKRECAEELGIRIEGSFVPLHHVKQPGGKTVVPFLVSADVDVGSVRSNTFTMEWPPKSGRTAEFPEVDRAEYFALPDARTRILRGQVPILEELAGYLDAHPGFAS